MRVNLYFFDSYTKESIWIAAILWPIYFIPFYLFISNNDKTKTFIYSVICSLIMASMSCLVFAKTIQEYVVFLLGISCLVFGPMLALSKKEKRREFFLLGILTGVVSSVILWFFRTKVYKSGLPNTEGRLDSFFSVGGMIWIVIMVSMYIYMLK